MKNKQTSKSFRKPILWFLTLLQMLVTTIVIQFMLERIPMHYDIDGNINRWGSKYENFIFPLVIIITTLFWSLFLMYFQKKQRKDNDDKQKKEAANNEKIVYLAAIGMTILFSIMHYSYMYSAMIEVKNNMTTSAIDSNIIVNVMLGIFIIIIGNFLPQAKLNSVVGIRTTWSKKNDKTWAATNRFGGIVFVIAGILIILETILTNSFLSTIIMLGIILLAAVLCTIYSYHAYQKYASE